MIQATWRSEKRKGKMNSYQYPTLGYTECKNGVVEAIRGDANNTFRCNNVRLAPHSHNSKLIFQD